MQTGTVKWFNERKGFGLIAPADGSRDVVVHLSAIVGKDSRPLTEGQAVEFEVTQDGKGARALMVRPIS